MTRNIRKLPAVQLTWTKEVGMTTKVLIVNFGPDHLLVRGFAKDNEPGDNTMGFTDADFVHPGQSKEFWVHSNRGLVVDEDRTGKFAPPDAGRQP